MIRRLNLNRSFTSIKRFAAVIGLTALMAVWYGTVTAEAVVYYASASGYGTTCSLDSPCSVTSGLSKATSGDKLVLKDGVYNNLAFDTKNHGVTIEAQNKHKATIVNGYSGHLIGIRHNNIKVRGLRIDGKGTAGSGVGVIRFYASSNIIIEHNLIEKVGGAPIIVGGSARTAIIKGIIIRHNIIRDSGMTAPGEAIYIGSASSEYGGSVTNVQVYGNTASRFTQNGFDFKESSVNVDAHHNILEGQYYRPISEKPGVESTVVMRNKSHRVHDNIIRDISDAGTAVIWTDATYDTQVYRNVIKNVTKTANAVATRGPGPGGTPSGVYSNTFCGLPTYKVQAEYGLKVYSNIGLPGGVSQNICDAEINRILLEIKNLPGINYGGSAPSVSLSSPTNLRISTTE